MGSKFMDSIRSIFFAADRGIYTLVGYLYDLIDKLAEIQLVSSVADIQNKLYSFIAIFMLFKISFSIINYIINPESITDKAKGGSKLIMNVVITFALIIIEPFAFNLLYEAQGAILDDNILPRIILGRTNENAGIYEFKTSPECKQSSTVTGVGNYVAMMTFRTFIQIDSMASQERIDDLKANTYYCTADSISKLLDSTIVTHSNKKFMASNYTYTVDYSIILSTIVGIIILLVFCNFCFDIALRSVKLTFLQIIAPIPIMSYIDPKSSKDGMFSKWLKEIGTTWADLFLRLAAVYFAVFLISSIKLEQFDILSGLIILIGALLFAKKLPDILKKMFNIDLKGDFSLNPLKKIEKEAFGGKQITGLATGLGASALALRNLSNGNSIRERFSNTWKNMKTGMSGGFHNPNTLKGLRSGTEEIRKKKKDEEEQIRKAKNDLANYKKDEKKMEKMVEDESLYDENGKFDVTKLFQNQKYIESYNRVKAAKSKVKEAEKKLETVDGELRQSQSERAIIDQKYIEAQEAYRNAVPGSAEASNARLQMESLANRRHEVDEKIKEQISEKSNAQGALKKANGVLDYEKEQHKLVQAIYSDDAEMEKKYSNYTNRNGEPTLSDRETHDSSSEESSTEGSPSGGSPSGGSSSGGSSSGGPSSGGSSSEEHSTPAPSGAHHAEFKSYDDIIRDNEKLKQSAEEERAKLTDDTSPEAEERKHKLALMISDYELKIHEAKVSRSKLSDEYPEEAADEIEYYVNNFASKKVQKLKEEYEQLGEKIKKRDKVYGEDFASDSTYSKDKTRYDELLEEIKSAESEKDSYLEDADKYREEAERRREHSHAEEDEEERIRKTERKKYILEELNKCRIIESEIKKKYGVLDYARTTEYKELEQKIRELEQELIALK